MSSATNAYEDLGYFCVDNLPLTMLSTFARLLLPNEEDLVAIEKAALVINIREGHFLSELPNELNKLRKRKLTPYVVFFEASDDSSRRFPRRAARTRPTRRWGPGGQPTERAAMKDIGPLPTYYRHSKAHGPHPAAAYRSKIQPARGWNAAKGPSGQLRA